MNQFISFIKKETLHIFRDKRSLFILLAMPIVQLLVFGYAITIDINKINFVVLDESKSSASLQLVSRLSDNKYFDLSKNIHSQSEIEKEFRQGKAKLALIIPSDFGNELQHGGIGKIQLIADASDPNEASIITMYAQQLINHYQQNLWNESKPTFKLSIEQKMLYNPQMISAYNFVPGIMGLILMLICAMMTSISIVREKEQGTMEILLVSPIKPIYIVLAKAVPYLAIAFVDILGILCIAHFIFAVPIVGSLALILLLSTLFLISALSLGLLVSSIAETQQTAMIMSAVGLMIPTMLLSGLIYAIENMPLPLQLFSNLIPAKWFIIALKDVMLKGLGFMAIAKECAILCVIAFVLLFVSIKRFKNRL